MPKPKMPKLKLQFRPRQKFRFKTLDFPHIIPSNIFSLFETILSWRSYRLEQRELRFEEKIR